MGRQFWSVYRRTSTYLVFSALVWKYIHHRTSSTYVYNVPRRSSWGIVHFYMVASLSSSPRVYMEEKMSIKYTRNNNYADTEGNVQSAHVWQFRAAVWRQTSVVKMQQRRQHMREDMYRYKRLFWNDDEGEKAEIFNRFLITFTSWLQ